MGGDVRSDPYDNHPISGQVAGIASGTVAAFPDQECIRAIIIAHPSNVGTAWIGNVTGTVNSLDGLPLNPSGIAVYLEGLSNLNLLVANFDVANDRLCWLIQRFD